ncbi:MAG: CDP-alcohol phosphatidyltransferase family protein [Candidatus Magasanikiibacteriota bacterium]
MSETEKLAADKKVGKWFFLKLEKKWINWAVPRLPKWLETQHLTLTTILWCALIIGFSYLAQYNPHWMWLVSLSIIGQYITDALDGALGRYRNSGLLRWGHYMDHFLDYMFLCAVLIGYSFLFNDKFNSLFFILVVFSAYLVNSYLYFSATNKFKISYLSIGPTEIRLLFVIINTLFIIFHKTYLAQFLPYVLVFSFLGLCWVVYDAQKEIWEIDQRNKLKQE